MVVCSMKVSLNCLSALNSFFKFSLQRSTVPSIWAFKGVKRRGVSDKGKPRVIWGRKATGPARVGRVAEDEALVG